jgi:hypothetical protein
MYEFLGQNSKGYSPKRYEWPILVMRLLTKNVPNTSQREGVGDQKFMRSFIKSV